MYLKIKNNANQIPEDLWELSHEEVWKLLEGSEITTTLDRKTRDQAVKPFEYSGLKSIGSFIKIFFRKPLQES